MLRKGILAVAVTAAIALAATQIGGCAGPSYYAQAISGHLRLMRSREEIDDVLERASTDEDLRRQLDLSRDILDFAHSELALPDNGSYSRLVRLDSDAVTWNVVAAEEFSVDARRWCFPVAGCVNYRGYFREEKAEQFADGLRSKGYDVHVSPAIAYSTLGWFEDPLPDTLFQYSDAQLAGFLFHELAHQRLYVSGDTDFSESYATFVEARGVELWLAERQASDQLSAWQAGEQAAMDFSHLLRQTRQELDALYRSGQDDPALRENKAAIIETMKAKYQELVSERWDDRDFFASTMSRPVNNASLALAGSYAGGVCSFRRLYRQAGERMERFHELAEEKSALDDEQRRAWLAAGCDDIASTADL